MKMLIVVFVAIAIVVVGLGFGAFVFVKKRNEEMRRTEPQRREAERLERLNQRVDGYISDDAMKSATFRATSLDYFGGYVEEWTYEKGTVVYQPLRMRTAPVDSVRIVLDEDQRLLLADILNLVVKQELWQQPDLEELAVDGGEQSYSFSVDGHHGEFTLINTSPPHLEVFQYKCWQLMQSLKEAAKGQVPDDFAGTDSHEVTN